MWLRKRGGGSVGLAAVGRPARPNRFLAHRVPPIGAGGKACIDGTPGELDRGNLTEVPGIIRGGPGGGHGCSRRAPSEPKPGMS